MSDIDIGIGADRDIELLTLGDIAGRLEDALDRPIDIVELRTLPERDPELAYRIAAESVLVAADDTEALVDFKKRAFLQYMDTEYLRTLMRDALEKRVLSGNMGRRDYV